MAEMSVNEGTLRLSEDELVLERSGLLSSSTEIVPLSAVASVSIETDASTKAVLAGLVCIAGGVFALVEGASGLGVALLGGAGLAGVVFYATRSYELVVLSLTGEIQASVSGRARDELEAFANEVRRAASGRA